MKPLFYGFSFLSSKIKKGYIGRKILIPNFNPKGQKVYWFHAASSGEATAAMPLIESLRTTENILPLMTYFSPSGFEVKRENIPQTYLPYDTPNAIKKFLKTYKPAKLIVIKWDLWPNILRICQEKNIPAFLLNADYSSQEKIGSFWWKFLHQRLLKYFDTIYVVSKNSQENLKRFNICSEYIGDLRYNVVQKNRVFPFHNKQLDLFCENSKIIVGGSVYRSDQKIIKEFLDQNPDYKAVIAPHNVNKKSIEEVRKIFGNIDLISSEKTLQSRVLVVDIYGILSKIYRFGNVAFVGGGKTGKPHNLLEAAVFSIPVFIGVSQKKAAFFEQREMENYQLLFPVKKGKEIQKIISNLPKNFTQKSEAFFQERLVNIETLSKKIREIG